VRIEWDDRKDRSNRKKHGISFDEASGVFSDEHARLIPDKEYDDRFILLGMSRRLRLLVVCHCYRLDDEVIRIISARKANRDEARKYEEYLL
jgi:uncharacterized DUF497 family protein